MKIEGYEEISEEEYWELPDNKGLKVWSRYEGKYHYFKKVQKFPIVFEEDDRKIEIYEDRIKLIYLDDGDFIVFAYDNHFPLLVKAVEKAKEVMKKNG